MNAVITGLGGRIFCDALNAIFWILLARVIVSWIVLAGGRPPVTGPFRTAIDLLEKITEPFLGPLRAIVPPAGMFDVSVMVAFVIIIVLQLALC